MSGNRIAIPARGDAAPDLLMPDLHHVLALERAARRVEFVPAPGRARNTKGYSSTYLAMGFANVRAGTMYPPEH